MTDLLHTQEVVAVVGLEVGTRFSMLAVQGFKDSTEELLKIQITKVVVEAVEQEL
jgi:hypothetical protein